MTLYLVRHGKASAGIDEADPGLDAIGRAQAQAAAHALASSAARRLVVSPLRRTRETAEPIASALGLEVTLDARIGEVSDPIWSAELRPAAIRALLVSRWSEQPDSLRRWRARVLAAFRDIGASAADVVVVSHYVAISVAIGQALGADSVAPGVLPNASITRFALRDAELVLLEAASIAHLSGELLTGGQTALAGATPPQKPAKR
jgi:broad specificity phosphatase PhoE